jgi:hypothetical protein
MAETNGSESGDQGISLENLSNALFRMETVDIPPNRRCSASTRSHQRNLSESSESGRPSAPATRQSSRASTNHFTRRYRGSLSSGRSPSLTPAEAYHYIQHTRRDSLAAVISPPTRLSQDGTAVSEDEGEETDDPELRKELSTILASAYGPPIPTPHCIQSFKKVVARQIHPEVQESMDKHLSESKAERAKHNATLDRLRKWSQWKEAQNTILGRLGSLFRSRPRIPKHEELVSLAKHYFPLRAEVKIYVCDFGENYFEKQEVPLGEIDNCRLYSLAVMIYTDLTPTCMKNPRRQRFVGCKSF